MSNILKAFINTINSYQSNVSTLTNGNNRANNMGAGLEEFIKDIFAGTINVTNETTRLVAFSQTYSYSGNKNNPPDLILRNSDAIEIKKLESHNTAIALNSSYPKAKLFSNSSMITTACRYCEPNWIIKDMLYVIGNVPKNTNSLKSLWFVYGDCFSADKEVYERIKDTISTGITSIPNVEFTETNELGKVKKVDPLGITDLRIRGMWHIENPTKIFNYLYSYDETKSFQLICLMKKDKYESMPSEDKQIIENLNNPNVSVSDVRIKNPNNPVQLMDGKFLMFKI
ncbi:NgoPII family restriction endonuclease [Aliarcobacter skirrowii]|uniref:Restriction endonuclease n=1 Tax=Aliarcobacter skirrowii CCUG 10374 TaxID=1032239 RepID=A0AAD0WPA4_9BACT|nr:NgoPII family restriction endonuclease [Aliarcobacter skirrowii]AXX85707.1 type IIP restriction/modification system, restriction endonuclease, HaeIII family [Aliarcobacter skirrowii CCUG 10374]KAB0619967.1 NgoPII family restriction endonuclease [Aliarcobacter skirrowii CCUG 10374]RXI25122.1 restriction endonuclease [Aliarcobacter skirrowii CCUG 10374]SUU95757.1 NgoPII restriction endonuclease [Aliarcobacter skirrowii]